jgi:NADP-dependent 3-hydroxy acid dehydrogenase YdfG
MSRIVVITGASAGIGAELAIQLGGRGDRLVLAARRETALRDVAERSGAESLVVVTDVTRRAEVDRLRDRAIERFGHVDVWVNNAGRGISRPVLDLSDEEFDLMMSLNAKSALYGMQAIAPHFLERRRGHIVNVSSMLGRVPFATYRSAYNAAKHALNALTANARADLHAVCPDVHVTLVMPGLVSTDFQRNALGGSPPLPANAPSQSAGEVARAIAAVIDRPVAEVYTNPALAGTVLKYFQDVGAFERELQTAR